MRNRQYRVRKRILPQRVMLLTVIVLAVFIFSFNILKPTSIDAHEPLQIIKVKVERGDSLWRIAERYDSNRMDLRYYIYMIQKHNNLENTLLQPGQVISVPIY